MRGSHTHTAHIITAHPVRGNAMRASPVPPHACNFCRAIFCVQRATPVLPHPLSFASFASFCPATCLSAVRAAGRYLRNLTQCAAGRCHHHHHHHHHQQRHHHGATTNTTTEHAINNFKTHAAVRARGTGECHAVHDGVVAAGSCWQARGGAGGVVVQGEPASCHTGICAASGRRG